MTELERDEWPCLQHGQCKWFKVDADRNESTCRRLDHKHIQFAVPWFKSYDCGQTSSCVCRDFQPAEWCRWLHEHWDGFDGYYGEDQKFDGYVWLVVDGNKDLKYAVKEEDFINGDFMDGDMPRWVKKQYYRRSKDTPTGYKLITEDREP